MLDLLAFARDRDEIAFLPEMTLLRDDRLDAGDLLLLELIPLFERFSGFRFFCGELLVVSGIKLSSCVFDIEDLRRRPVEEIPVVRNEDQRFRISAQMLLEPVERIGVEMIGRLVQNQDIRLNEQQPHQREPCALSAGKRRDPLALLRLGKAEARQHGADAGFVLISADLPEFLRQRGKFRDHFFVALVVDCA